MEPQAGPLPWLVVHGALVWKIALVGCVAGLPLWTWWRRRRSAAQSGRDLAALLGEPTRDAGRFASGTVVTLEGIMRAEGPVERIEDGQHCAASTVADPTGGLRARSRRAGQLALQLDGARVVLHGPVEVAGGSVEQPCDRPVAQLDRGIQDRMRAARDGSGAASADSFELAAWSEVIPVMRSLVDGDRVRVRGRLALAADPRGGAGYREAAQSWQLEPEDAVVPAVFTAPPSVASAGAGPYLRSAGLGLVLFVLLFALDGLVLMELAPEPEEAADAHLSWHTPEVLAAAMPLSRQRALVHIDHVQRRFPESRRASVEARVALSEMRGDCAEAALLLERHGQWARALERVHRCRERGTWPPRDARSELCRHARGLEDEGVSMERAAEMLDECMHRWLRDIGTRSALALGRFDEAAALLAEGFATRMKRRSAISRTEALAYLLAGDQERDVQALQRTYWIDRDPDVLCLARSIGAARGDADAAARLAGDDRCAFALAPDSGSIPTIDPALRTRDLHALCKAVPDGPELVDALSLDSIAGAAALLLTDDNIAPAIETRCLQVLRGHPTPAAVAVRAVLMARLAEYLSLTGRNHLARSLASERLALHADGGLPWSDAHARMQAADLALLDGDTRAAWAALGGGDDMRREAILEAHPGLGQFDDGLIARVVFARTGAPADLPTVSPFPVADVERALAGDGYLLGKQLADLAYVPTWLPEIIRRAPAAADGWLPYTDFAPRHPNMVLGERLDSLRRWRATALAAGDAALVARLDAIAARFAEILDRPENALLVAYVGFP